MQLNKVFPGIWLVLAILVELGFQTWWNKDWGIYMSPIALFLAGVTTCWIAYKMVAFEKTPIQSYDAFEIKRWSTLLVGIIFFVGTFLLGLEYDAIQAKYPVSPDGSNSDVIPSLILYVQRFLSGEFPYQPLVFNGWTVLPTYFPVMWLPYCFSEILGIDYRWTAYLVFLIPLFIYQVQLTKQKLWIGELVFKTAFPFVILMIYMKQVDYSFGYGVELMPIGLYFLLTLVLKKNSPWLIAIPIVLVLLSRYAFTFWLPVFLLMVWIEKGFMPVFKISLGVLGGVLALYVIPFLSKDWSIFTEGLAYYAKTAESVWRPAPWQQPDEKPALMTGGLSFAIFFYDFWEGDILEKLKANRIFHILACAFAALILFIGYLKNRKKQLNISLYFLIGLKFYLIVFYSFFYVPFRYLYELPMLLSIPILYHIPLFNFERKNRE